MNGRIFLASLLIFLAPSFSWACSIPVFRYALERWELGPYEAILFHRGPLSAAEKSRLLALEEPSPRANITLTTVDLADQVEAEFQKLWNTHGKDQPLPLLMVRNVNADPMAVPLWVGTPTPQNLQRVIGSPARQKLVQHLAKGTSAVFLLLESGDAQADHTAAQLLDKELALLKKKVQLPEQTLDGPQLRFPLPLRSGFSVLKISRQEAEEEVFLQMLLKSEEDLHVAKGPIVFPVFGRGRLLCSLQGKDLNGEQLTNVVRFLCGACSCQVKELNPGVDLLISADWLEILESTHVSAALSEQITLPLVLGVDYLEEKASLWGKTSQKLQAWNSQLGKGMEETPAVPPSENSPKTLKNPASEPSENPESPKSSTETVTWTATSPSSQTVETPGMGRRFWLLGGAAGALVLVIFTGVWLGRSER
jgi:hypothetical protein